MYTHRLRQLMQYSSWIRLWNMLSLALSVEIITGGAYVIKIAR